MRRDEAMALPPAPRGGCPLCGAAVRFSHTDYIGGGESLALHRCSSCGSLFRGAVRDREEQAAERGRAGRGGRRARERPLPDGGSPDNPVIDEETARLLRERLG